MSREEDNGGDNESVSVLYVPGNGGDSDFLALMELTISQNEKPVK
jgi:hypothetical protein